MHIKPIDDGVGNAPRILAQQGQLQEPVKTDLPEKDTSSTNSELSKASRFSRLSPKTWSRKMIIITVAIILSIICVVPGES